MILITEDSIASCFQTVARTMITARQGLPEKGEFERAAGSNVVQVIVDDPSARPKDSIMPIRDIESVFSFYPLPSAVR